MELMGFPKKFIKWTKNCIGTASFSFNLNSSFVGYFRSQKELRQGDLISPYLFLIVMKVFSLLLAKQVQNEDFDYHPNVS